MNVVIETMPDFLRQRHREARNWGVYPHNGAERSVVSAEEAEDIVAADEDGYDHVVEGAVVPPMTVIEQDGTLCVEDPAGGVWWPSDEAAAAIAAADDPQAEALRICDAQPMRGDWA